MNAVIGGPHPGTGSMAGVEARMSAIQARIDGLAGGGPGRAAPVFDLASADVAGGADVTLNAGSSSSDGLRSGPAAAGSEQMLNGPTTAATTPNPPAAPGQDARGSVLAGRLPEHGRHLASAIEDAAIAAGIEPSLLAALVRHESNFRQSVVSHAGAIGLAQLMPGTAAGLGVNPHDPLENLAGGARYLREQLDRFGSPELALAAYNAGPNRVAQAGGIPKIQETQTYVGRVMSTWEQLR